MEIDWGQAGQVGGIGFGMVFLLLINESLRINSDELSICLEFIKGVLSISLDSVKLSLRELKENDIPIEDIRIVIGRGGLVRPVQAGAYRVLPGWW